MSQRPPASVINHHRFAPTHATRLKMKDKLEFMPKLSLFRDWNKTRLIQLAYTVQEANVHRGQVVFSQGDPVTGILMLKSGTVREVVKAPRRNPYKSVLAHRIAKDDVEICIRSSRSFLGEVHVANGHQQQRTTCIACEECELYMITFDSYNKFIRRFKIDDNHLIEISAHRVAQIERRLATVKDFRVQHPILRGPVPQTQQRRHRRSLKMRAMRQSAGGLEDQSRESLRGNTREMNNRKKKSYLTFEDLLSVEPSVATTSKPTLRSSASSPGL